MFRRIGYMTFGAAVVAGAVALYVYREPVSGFVDRATNYMGANNVVLETGNLEQEVRRALDEVEDAFEQRLEDLARGREVVDKLNDLIAANEDEIAKLSGQEAEDSADVSQPVSTTVDGTEARKAGDRAAELTREVDLARQIVNRREKLLERKKQKVLSAMQQIGEVFGQLRGDDFVEAEDADGVTESVDQPAVPASLQTQPQKRDSAATGGSVAIAP